MMVTLGGRTLTEAPPELSRRERLATRLQILLAGARLYRFLTRRRSSRPTAAQLMSMPQAEFEAWIRSTGIQTVSSSVAGAAEGLTDAAPTPRHA